MSSGAVRTVVMTGASRGIGQVAAARIAALEPRSHLVLLGRRQAGWWSERICPAEGSVHAIHADLTQLDSVRAAAQEVHRLVDGGAVPAVDALVLNAGVQRVDAATSTPDGFEMTFAVNVLANHVLVRDLGPSLPAGGRLVVTVSDTHFGDLRHNLGMVPGPQWHDPDVLARPGAFPRPGSTTAGRTAYSTSKLAMIYLVHEYARRFRDVSVIGYNPAFVPGTGLAREAGPATRLLMARFLPLLARTPLASTPDIAGRDLALLATGRLAAPTGSYVDRDRVVPSSAESYRPDREQRMWQIAETLTAGTGRGYVGAGG